MSKVYSNKALPPGTVLREWRLEEVLGVGGFGIVYKARGIYFDELVAIKEYFPSAISERQPDDTIVPVDSAAEEVHALGLKKFVEEAKLLWNLSTPSRHPNIVSVRSLFEIHGSAYMVMDFEDGASLSKLLKEGRRFNQASLTALIRPIAEGLERAHRVGVLHRDIKPPNILVSHDNRPVLIDFGSARFDKGDATSTSVTFHTPPYAAIEQYVKTYPQGPWTDIYALGVVLHECVTGEKPAEVLERLHGNADRPLAGSDWPGFSQPFLAAIDAAMAIRPDDRPQSISAWLELFDSQAAAPPPPASDDTTRIASFAPSATAAARIQPVAPPAPGFETRAEIRTPVPDTPSAAEFRSAGMATRGDRPTAAATSAAIVPAEALRDPATAVPPAATPGTAAPSPASRPLGRYAAVAGAVAVIAGGLYLGTADAPQPAAPAPGPATAAPPATAARPLAAGVTGAELATLASDARTTRPSAAEALAAAAARITALETGAAPATGRDRQIAALALPALQAFTTSIAADVDARARRAARQLPWTGSTPPGAAPADPRQPAIAAALQAARAAVARARAGSDAATTAGAALPLARQALAAAQAHAAALADARRLVPAAPARPQAAAAPDTAAAASPAAPPAGPAPAGAVADSTRAQFRSVVAAARDVARDVIRLGDRGRPGARATDAERAAYRLRQANAQSARTYQEYLKTLSRSMDGTTSEAEARQSIAKAQQTQTYLNGMLAASQASLP